MNLRQIRKLPILYRTLSFLRRTGGRAWMRTMRRAKGIQKNTVLFTSFKGKSYSDSPRCISEVLHVLRPDIDIAWQIANPADVPDYVRPVKPRSLAALTELATARCFVDNFNRPIYLEKYPGQLRPGTATAASKRSCTIWITPSHIPTANRSILPFPARNSEQGFIARRSGITAK